VINEIAVAVQANVPVIIWGDPGTGKTATITAMADVLSWPLEIVIASIREPSDFSGLPVVSVDGGVRLVSPSWAVRLSQVERGILFFDELSCAPPANQAALLRVVNERWVGETQLGPGVSIIACSNPPETAAGGWDLPPAQANRFCHIKWEMDPVARSAWITGLISGFPDPKVPRLARDWEKLIPEQRGLIAAFLHRQQHLVMKVPENESTRGEPWPSPRTWTMAARLSAASKSVGLMGEEECEYRLMAGCVGAGTITAFMSWRREMDLPDPETLLKNPNRYKHPNRGDRAFAILSSVVTACMKDKTQPRYESAWEIMGVAASAGGADIAVTHAAILSKGRTGMNTDFLTKGTSMKPLFPLLKATGLLV